MTYCLYVPVGEGFLLVDKSPQYNTWRFTWLPNEEGVPPFRRYGNETGYPKDDDPQAVLDWVREQDWAKAKPPPEGPST
jgi:hypothetical protein